MGAISLSGANVTIRGSNFSNNAAGFGSAVHADAYSRITVKGSIFTDNYASLQGTVFVGSNSQLVVRQSTFVNNRADTDGGVFYVTLSSTAMILGSTFDSNTALSAGGVIHSYFKCMTYIAGCDFTRNIADMGAVFYGQTLQHRYTNYKIVEVRTSTFEKNQAMSDGGVFYFYQVEDWTIIENSFTNNSAGEGGGIMYSEWSRQSLFDSCNFTSNSAFYGGDIYALNTELKVELVTISDSKADEAGSIYFSSDSSVYAELEILDTSFEECQCNQNGGAILVYAPVPSIIDVDLRSVIFSNCKARRTPASDAIGIFQEQTHPDFTLAYSHLQFYGNVSPAATSFPDTLVWSTDVYDDTTGKWSSEPQSLCPGCTTDLTISSLDLFSQEWSPVEFCSVLITDCIGLEYELILSISDDFFDGYITDITELSQCEGETETEDFASGNGTLYSFCVTPGISGKAFNVSLECEDGDNCPFFTKVKQFIFADCGNNDIEQTLYGDDRLYSCDSFDELYDAISELLQSNTVLFIVIGFAGTILLVGFLAYLHSVRGLDWCPVYFGNYKVQGVKWYQFFTYVIQFIDLITDINLSYSLIHAYILTVNAGNTDNIYMLLSLVSCLFIIIPYAANLFATCWLVKHLKEYCQHNQYSTGWLQGQMVWVAILVIISGGIHPTLSLVNSRLFGLMLFSMGLSHAELVRLSFLKIYFSVVLENLPQFAVQLMVVYYQRHAGIGVSVLISLISSVVAMLTALLSSFMERSSQAKEMQWRMIVNVKSPNAAANEDELNFEWEAEGAAEPPEKEKKAMQKWDAKADKQIRDQLRTYQNCFRSLERGLANALNTSHSKVSVASAEVSKCKCKVFGAFLVHMDDSRMSRQLSTASYVSTLEMAKVNTNTEPAIAVAGAAEKGVTENEGSLGDRNAASPMVLASPQLGAQPSFEVSSQSQLLHHEIRELCEDLKTLGETGELAMALRKFFQLSKGNFSRTTVECILQLFDVQSSNPERKQSTVRSTLRGTQIGKLFGIEEKDDDESGGGFQGSLVVRSTSKPLRRMGSNMPTQSNLLQVGKDVAPPAPIQVAESGQEQSGNTPIGATPLAVVIDEQKDDLIPISPQVLEATPVAEPNDIKI